MTASGSTLVLAAVVAVYVLLLLVAWWGRHRQHQLARQWQLEHHELMRELERYERGQQ